MTETIGANIASVLAPYRIRTESALEKMLPAANCPPTELHTAIRYSTLDAGKRLRACLVYLTGEMLGASLDVLDPAATAIELIHAYSLVHDDLPCMDDDDLRRNKPSCHKKFDEATALLVGDSLQSMAFEALTSPAYSDDQRCSQLVLVLAKASGSLGMAGGQAMDLAAEGKSLPLIQLQKIHALKTGALIEAAVLMGAHASGLTDKPQLSLLASFAKALGLGFQIRDDILDVISSTEALGKQTGADENKAKATYPGLMGLEAATKAAEDAHTEARQALQQLPFNTQNLQLLANYAVSRLN